MSRVERSHPARFAGVIRGAVALAAMAALSLGLAPTAADAEDQVVKVGVLAALSGPGAADGEETVRGVTLAFEEINASGFVPGYKFEAVPSDVKDQTTDAVLSGAERLLSDGDINFIMTGYASLSNFEIEFMRENEMPYFVAGNSQQTREIVSPDPDAYWMIWSLTPSYDGYEVGVLPVVDGLASAGKITLKNKKLAIISSDNAYSKTIYEGLKKSFTGAGWTVTVDELIPSGEVNDWRAFLAKVRQDPPDLVINTDWVPSNAVTFITQFLEDPTDSLVFIQYGPSVPEFLDLTKDKATGVIYNLLGGHIPTLPRTQEISQKFKERWGVEPGPYGVGLYEMTYMYAEAVKKAGNPSDRRAVAKALSETDKPVAEGHAKFDQKTHLTMQSDDHIPLTFFQIWEGKRYLFAPTKYADGEFRKPPWMK
jgi:branched-chain amino acid transport system substrate-binding protein